MPPLFSLLLAGLTACATTERPAPPPAATVVPERYLSAPLPGEELDSLEVWASPDGPRLIATGKSSHRLTVFDAEDGKVLEHLGGRDVFHRPNGLTLLPPAPGRTQTLLFVVERDARRVQAFTLPGFTPAGSFGQDVLRSPYGIWINAGATGGPQAYVTDSFMYGSKFDVLPELPEMGQRVRRFSLQVEAGKVQGRHLGDFGDTSEQGALRMVESLAGDAAHDRLMVADEYTRGPRRGSTLREYTLDGRWTGRSLPEGSFDAEAEGVLYWACSPKQGYWVAVDQLTPLTRFHVFERRSLKHAGTWQGQTTADTDGIALHTGATPRFPAGALFAVHQDKQVAAFDLGQVARSLGLAAACRR